LIVLSGTSLAATGDYGGAYLYGQMKYTDICSTGELYQSVKFVRAVTYAIGVNS